MIKKDSIIMNCLIFLLILFSYSLVSNAEEVMQFGEGEEVTEEETTPQEEGTQEGTQEGTTEETDILSGITEETPEELPQAEEIKNVPQLPIYAVQQIYALKRNRFELVPRFGFSLNDPYVQHYTFNVGFNWYITEVLGIGAEFGWYYLNDETDTNYHIARSYRLIEPINEDRFAFSVNFSYIPIYGKFSLWNYWILYWDLFIIGGVGMTETRPIAAVDPEYRDFTIDGVTDAGGWNYSITIPVGIGGRLFISRFLAIFAEVRGYLTPQKIESNDMGNYTCGSLAACETEAQADENDTTSGADRWTDSRANSNTWYGDTDWVFNTMFQVGISIFLPPTFSYHLPK